MNDYPIETVLTFLLFGFYVIVHFVACVPLWVYERIVEGW